MLSRGFADGLGRRQPWFPTLLVVLIVFLFGAGVGRWSSLGATQLDSALTPQRALRPAVRTRIASAPRAESQQDRSPSVNSARQSGQSGSSTRRVPTAAECAPYLKRVTEYFPGRLGFKTSCPREIRWFDWFRKMDPSPKKKFVNIGCNKGADVAAFLHLWDPTFQTSDWVRKVPKYFREAVGGACGQTSGGRKAHTVAEAPATPCPRGSPKWGCSCQNISDVFGVTADITVTPHGNKVKHPADVEAFWAAHNCSTSPSDMAAYDVKPVVPPAADGARPVAFCVEIMPQTAEALKKVRGALPAEDQQLVVVDNVAVGSGYPKTVSVSNVGAGRENGGIGIEIKGASSIDVQHTTLDSYTSKDARPIDFLLIDTEGNDANVLFGGGLTLKRTRFVAFENHDRGFWLQVSLRAVIDYLDALDFECYWAGNMGTLWQITGCYPYIDSKPWGNVACAKRGDLLLDTMRMLADTNGGIPDLT